MIIPGRDPGQYHRISPHQVRDMGELPATLRLRNTVSVNVPKKRGVERGSLTIQFSKDNSLAPGVDESREFLQPIAEKRPLYLELLMRIGQKETRPSHSNYLLLTAISPLAIFLLRARDVLQAGRPEIKCWSICSSVSRATSGTTRKSTIKAINSRPK